MKTYNKNIIFLIIYILILLAIASTFFIKSPEPINPAKLLTFQSQELLKRGFSLSFTFIPKLHIHFTLSLIILMISTLLHLNKPRASTRMINAFVVLSIISNISYQSYYVDSSFKKTILTILVFLIAITFFQNIKRLSPSRTYFDTKSCFQAKHIITLIAISSFCFFFKFPLQEINNIIFQDDYPKYLYFAKHQLNILKKGSLFGWNHQFSGGYPSFLDLRLLSIIFLPFSFLGDNLGFHIMIYFIYISIPLLVYWLSIKLFQCSKISIVNGIICCLLMITYFGNILSWGMLPGFISLNLILLSFILIESCIQKNKYSLFFLALTLGFLFYIHLLFFAFAIFFLLVRILNDTLANTNTFSVKKWCLACLFFILLTLPFSYLLIKYANYIIFSSKHVNATIPVAASLPDFISKIKTTPIFLLDLPTARALWFILPIAVSVYFSNKKARNLFIYFFSFIFIFVLSAMFHATSARRLVFLIPIFFSLVSGLWIVKDNQSVSRRKLFIIIGLCLLSIEMRYLISPIMHVPSIKRFQPELTERLHSFDDNLILFENTTNHNASNNPFGQYIDSGFPHFEGLLANETGKSFLSHYGSDPYPYFLFREGLIANGLFNGEDISKTDIKTVVQTLNKWNIKSIVIYSDHAINYLKRHPVVFQKQWANRDFSLFQLKPEFQKKDSSFRIIKKDPFSMNIELANVKKGETITLNTNYFPAWKAYYKKKQLDLFKHNGQLALIAPENGDISINLSFPRHKILFLISLFSIPLFFFLSKKHSV